MQLKNTLNRDMARSRSCSIGSSSALIITQFVLAKRAEGLPPVAKIGILATHKSVGITILGLALLRLAWRLFNPVPPLPSGTPRWQERAAHVSHFLLYALLFITPVLGWLMSSARAFSVSWFGPGHAARFHRAEPGRLTSGCTTAHEAMAKTLAASPLRAHRGRAQASLRRSRQCAAPDAAGARPHAESPDPTLSQRTSS